jgi:hypothetical protein
VACYVCIVGLRLCLYYQFCIVDSRWSTNNSNGQEGPLFFHLKVWSFLLESVEFPPVKRGIYTTSFSELVCETLSNMENPIR